MFILKLWFCVVIISGSEKLFSLAQRRRCFDCVSITSCETGLDFASKLRQGLLPDSSKSLFFGAICGYDARIPKVCCSDFPEIPVVLPTASRVIEDRIGGIETHANMHLLPSSCGDIDGSRIINGEIAKLYEFPWMVLIAYKTALGMQFRCAGSIINSRYILTAAHCVIDGQTRKLKNIVGVRIGEFDYANKTDCQGHLYNMICEDSIQDIEVEKFIPHNDFTGYQPIEADIALLRLKEEITMGNNAAPICLPVYESLIRTDLAGKTGTVAGWGVTENRTESTYLMKVDLPILTGDACNTYYNRFNDENAMDKSFCAGKKKKDTCEGDSGGPFMVESDFNDSIRLVQFGIVSYGPKICGSEFPGVYTDVRKYSEWILDNIHA